MFSSLSKFLLIIFTNGMSHWIPQCKSSVQNTQDDLFGLWQLLPKSFQTYRQKILSRKFKQWDFQDRGWNCGNIGYKIAIFRYKHRESACWNYLAHKWVKTEENGMMRRREFCKCSDNGILRTDGKEIERRTFRESKKRKRERERKDRELREMQGALRVRGLRVCSGGSLAGRGGFRPDGGSGSRTRRSILRCREPGKREIATF